MADEQKARHHRGTDTLSRGASNRLTERVRQTVQKHRNLSSNRQTDQNAAEEDAFTRKMDAAALRVGRATNSFMIKLLDHLPFKPDSPYSTKLVRHYAEGSGEAVTLPQVPQSWQDWIAKTIKGKPGHYRNVSPYGVGLYDLQNSLGHFDLDVTRTKDGQTQYSITDFYKFDPPATRNSRHGFHLGKLGTRSLWLIRNLLPTEEYRNEKGLVERWQIERIHGEEVLFIPQPFLAEHGVPFKVGASFRR